MLDDSTVLRDSLTQCHTAHQAFDLAEIATANFISQIEDIEDCNFGLGPAQERKAPDGFWKSFSPSQQFWECLGGLGTNKLQHCAQIC